MLHFSSSPTLAPLSSSDEMGDALCLSIEQCRTTFEGQNVLVMGASGLVGTHIVRALHRAGANVTATEPDLATGHALTDLIVHGGFATVFHLAHTALPSLGEAARLLPLDKQPLIVHLADQTLEYPHRIGLQLCRVFGPQDLDFEASPIAKAMLNIFRDGESPELSMNAMEEFHDYIFVEDAVRALLHLACAETCRGNYELSGAHYGATADVLREIVSQVGSLQDEMALVEPRSALARHHWNRSIRIVPSKPEEKTLSTPRRDGSRLWREAGFESCTSFREGLQLTAQFYAGYFSQMAPVKPRFKAVLPRQERRAEPAFETVYTDDGLPVYVLNPHAHVRDKGAPRANEHRPRSFLVESALSAI